MNINMTNATSNCCHYNVSVGLDGHYGQKSKTTKRITVKHQSTLDSIHVMINAI